MTNSVYGIALSGLNAARSGLATTSNNIANANTVGYNRQQVIQQARPSFGSDIGYIGQGVDIESVQRVYSEFLNAQEQKATSEYAFFNAKYSQISRVDGLIADDTSGLSSALSDFFSAAQTLSTSPGDLPARQNFLSAADSLAGRFNSLNAVLDDLRAATNLQVKDTVTQINDVTGQIAELNDRIVAVKSQDFNSGAPNDLMDKRDALIKQLAEQVQVTRVNMDDGSVNLFLGNGQPLVVKTNAFKVSTEVDPQDPKNLLVGTTQVVNGQNRLITLDPSTLGKGALAGYLSFRETELAEYQNTVGLMAARIGEAVNTVQQAGVDLDGNAGQALFAFGTGSLVSGVSRVVPNTANSTTNPTTVSMRSIDLSKVSAVDYEVTIVGGQPQYRVQGSGSPFTAATLVNDPGGDYYEIRDSSNAPILSFQLSNASPQNGDTFTLMPTRDAAQNMRMALSKPNEVAASSTTNASVGNNENIKAINALQNQRTLFQSNGAAGVSISDAFNQLVSKVGNKARELKVSTESREVLLNQVVETRDALSGVNMDEEAANLLKYQQAYQAAGRVISLSKEMFEQILQIF